MFLELKAGSIDQMGLSPLQYARQTDSKEFKARFNKYRYLASSYLYLGYNLRNKLFQDKLVRQGLSHAINREEIIDGVLMGYGRPATGGFKPGTWAHDPNIKPITFDQKKARELLAQAGWKDTDQDGVLDKDGIPLAFTIVTNQGNSQRLKTAIIIQERFKQVGVKVKIRAVEWSALLKEFIDKQNFEATIMGWTLPLDPDPYAVWHSSKAEPGGLNFIGFKNEEVDRLILSARETFDQEKRKKAYFRFSGDHPRGAALQLPLRPGRAARGGLPDSRHKTGPGRDRLQLHKVVRTQGTTEVPLPAIERLSGIWAERKSL